jgi:hypothetical protein
MLFDGDFFFGEFFVTKGDLLLLPLAVVFFVGDLLCERVTNGVLDLFDKRPRGAGRVEFMSLLSALNKFVIIRARRYCTN